MECSELQLFHKPCIQFTNRGFCSNSGCPYNHTKRGNRRDCLGFQNGSCKKGSLCIYRHDESCYPNGSPILPPSDIKIASADRNNKRVIKPLSSPPEFECSECNAKLESRNKLFVHIQTNHQNHPTSKSGENIARRESKIFITDNLDLHIIQDYDIFRVICKPQGLPTMSGQGITVQNSPVICIHKDMYNVYFIISNTASTTTTTTNTTSYFTHVISPKQCSCPRLLM